MSNIKDRQNQVWQLELAMTIIIVIEPYDTKKSVHPTILIHGDMLMYYNASELEHAPWETHSFMRRLV
jgi:hypothetical protein